MRVRVRVCVRVCVRDSVCNGFCVCVSNCVSLQFPILWFYTLQASILTFMQRNEGVQGSEDLGEFMLCHNGQLQHGVMVRLQVRREENASIKTGTMKPNSINPLILLIMCFIKTRFRSIESGIKRVL
jgi:hypothetical protein